MVGSGGFALILCLALLLAAVGGSAAKAESCNSVAETVIWMIKGLHDPDVLNGRKSPPRLDLYVGQTPSPCVRQLVPVLVQQLADGSDLVRLYAATALGKIGPSARDAVPALEQAMTLEKCVCWDGVCAKPSWSSTAAMGRAIEQITGNPVDPEIYKCQYDHSTGPQP